MIHWYVDRNELTIRPIEVTDWDWGGSVKFNWYTSAMRTGLHKCGEACVSKESVFENYALAAESVLGMIGGQA